MRNILLFILSLVALIILQASPGEAAHKIKGKVLVSADSYTQCKAHEVVFFQKVCLAAFEQGKAGHLLIVDGPEKGLELEKGQAIILKARNVGKTKARFKGIIRSKDELKPDTFKEIKNIVLWMVGDDTFFILDADKPLDVPAGDGIKMKVKGKKVQKVEGC